jgi:tetratricopeptide (TPR) repeat protein
MATAAEAPEREVGPDPDSALDSTDPTDWTTPDAPGSAEAEAEPEAAEPIAAAEPEPAAETPAPPAPEAPPLELTAPEIAAEGDGAAAFDLAAELSDAMRDESEPSGRSGATEEDGFAALFSEFKRGVSRTLDEGDVETHFDLGIAYREMGLLDDAIGEFRYALGSATRRLDALHMMGLCALDVGRAADAIGHLEQALASPDVPGEREAALRYDLGRAYDVQGDRDRALGAFERVLALAPGIQDTAERIEALRAGPTASAPKTGGDEAYESFDDFLAQTSDDAVEGGEAPTETYESFAEFDGDSEAAPADEPDPNATTVVQEVEVEPAETAVAEVEPEPEPEPEEPPRRRKRKISFF